MQQFQTIEEAAAALAAACKAGELAAAYRVLGGFQLAEVERIALHAGFSCVSRKYRRGFMVHLQQQIAAGARARADGWGLRKACGDARGACQ